MDLGEQRDALADAVRRFVPEHRARLAAQRLEGLSPRTLLARKESLEDEAIDGQTAEKQGGDQGHRPRQDLHPRPGLDRRSYGAETRIAHAGRARVADQGHGLPLLEQRAELHALPGLVVLMEAEELRLDSEVSEETTRVPRVLGGHDVRLLQHLERAEGDVLQIAQGRRHEDEPARHQAASA